MHYALCIHIYIYSYVWSALFGPIGKVTLRDENYAWVPKSRDFANVLTIKHTQGFQSDNIKLILILTKLYVLVLFDKDIDNMM